MKFEFADIYFLLLIPLWVILRIFFRSHPAGIYHPMIPLMTSLPRPWRSRLFPYLEWLLWIALTLMIIALSRPRLSNVMEKISSEGIDIVLALDISRSMLIEDMNRQNRIETAKEVAVEFVRNRVNDRLGLVLFAGKSFTQCPLTSDYALITRSIQAARTGMIEDGTAIGMGLINAVNRLRYSEAKSKVIILLTDGQNNRGEIDPLTAAGIAQALQIRVYTIGIGKDGLARIPVDDPVMGKLYIPAEVKIDEPTLREIAVITGGKFYRATSRESLQDIYSEIDQLEKTRIEMTTLVRYRELYPWFLIPAFFLFILYGALRQTLFLRLP